MGLYRYVRVQRVRFVTVLLRNRVSILVILVVNRVWLLYSSFELSMFLEEATFLSLSIRPSTKAFHNGL